MKRDIRDQWIAALRSGEYKQGNGVLHQVSKDGAERFCCLGVLCRVLKETPSPVQKNGDVLYDNLCGILSSKLRDLVGIRIQTMDEIIWMNDQQRWSFDQIADWVQANL